MNAIVIAGTDTDVGKTVFAAALAGALGADYFKPVQAGLEPPTDTDTVRAYLDEALGDLSSKVEIEVMPMLNTFCGSGPDSDWLW